MAVVTDPIADLLTRIRNANTANHQSVDVPASKLKRAIVEILKAEGFINDYEIRSQGQQGTLHIVLKYGPEKEKVITGLRRISRPGLRVYAAKTVHRNQFDRNVFRRIQVLFARRHRAAPEEE